MKEWCLSCLDHDKDKDKNSTYSMAQYPWQIEIPPIILDGKFFPDSPKYLVIRFPPSENPTATTCVPGWRFTKLDTIEW